MDIKDIPDRKKRNFPGKITVSVSATAAQTAEFLRNRGKNISEFLRPDVEKKLAAAKNSADKKIG